VYNESNNWGTCSDDGTFRVWSADEKKQLNIASLNVGKPKTLFSYFLDESGKPLPADEKTKDLVDAAKGRCCEISPKDDTIVIGCKDGTIRVHDI
jgi:WD40 repeat protein